MASFFARQRERQTDRQTDRQRERERERERVGTRKRITNDPDGSAKVLHSIECTLYFLFYDYEYTDSTGDAEETSEFFSFFVGPRDNEKKFQMFFWGFLENME